MESFLRPNQYIRSIELVKDQMPVGEYPFNLEAVKQLTTLAFKSPVTFIVGDNGTGKSTLLEAIAIAYGFNPEGGTKNFNFSTRDTHSKLHNHLKIVKGVVRPKDSFFFRAESFYNMATHIDESNLNAYFGFKSLHDESHGESFFSVFNDKFKGNGIYILDEPEAALSPLRQMSMIAIIHELVKTNSQLIIATHSPIIMAYPDAEIYQIDQGYKKVVFEETEHYKIMRDFMNNPTKMLDILMDRKNG